MARVYHLRLQSGIRTVDIYQITQYNRFIQYAEVFTMKDNKAHQFFLDHEFIWFCSKLTLFYIVVFAFFAFSDTFFFGQALIEFINKMKQEPLSTQIAKTIPTVIICAFILVPSFFFVVALVRSIVRKRLKQAGRFLFLALLAVLVGFLLAVIYRSLEYLAVIIGIVLILLGGMFSNIITVYIFRE